MLIALLRDLVSRRGRSRNIYSRDTLWQRLNEVNNTGKKERSPPLKN
jgi:hypothetical protein